MLGKSIVLLSKRAEFTSILWRNNISLGGSLLVSGVGQFRNHSMDINWSIIKPGLLPWKITSHVAQIPRSFFFWKLIEPYNAVCSTRIDRVFTRHAAGNISPGAQYFCEVRGPSLAVRVTGGMRASAGLTRSYIFWSVWHFLSRLTTRSRTLPAVCSPFTHSWFCKLLKCLVIKANVREKCFATVLAKTCQNVTQSFSV